MNSQKSTKINQLLKGWPKGTLAVVSWLEKQGVDRKLARRYCETNWLSRFDNGVYKQSDDLIDWTGAVYTLQKELNCKIHVAARSAFEMQGMSHYLPLGSSLNILFAAGKRQQLPTWFLRHFGNEVNVYFPKSLFNNLEIGLQEKSLKNFSIMLSSPERAIMECLYLTPKKMSLEHVIELMEKQHTLRPNLLQILLGNCKSIKVKRLFLYFAEIQEQPWLNRIDISKINLGKGKRVIEKDGKYKAKYQISIPDFDKHEGILEDKSEF
jgi:hypothetical protein